MKTVCTALQLQNREDRASATEERRAEEEGGTYRKCWWPSVSRKGFCSSRWWLMTSEEQASANQANERGFTSILVDLAQHASET